MKIPFCSPSKSGRRLLAVLSAGAAVLLLTSARAASGPPVYEPFDYTDAEGTPLNTGNPKTFWNSGTGVELVLSNSSALSYPGLSTSNGTKGVHFPRTIFNNVKFNLHSFTTQPTNGPLYFSCLIKVNALPAAQRPFLQFGSASASVSSGLTLFLDQSGGLAMAKASNTNGEVTAGTPITVGSTNLIVGRYQFNTNSTTDDTIDVWINPTNTSFGANTPPASTMTGDSGRNDVSVLKSLLLMGGPTATNAAIEMELDEIRVDFTWAGVTPPAAGSPHGQTNATITVTATNATVTFFGVSVNQFVTERSTNLATGLGWLAISTNTPPANGTFQVTDNFSNLGLTPPPVPSSVFYRLRY